MVVASREIQKIDCREECIIKIMIFLLDLLVYIPGTFCMNLNTIFPIIIKMTTFNFGILYAKCCSPNYYTVLK